MRRQSTNHAQVADREFGSNLKQCDSGQTEGDVSRTDDQDKPRVYLPYEWQSGPAAIRWTDNAPESVTASDAASSDAL